MNLANILTDKKILFFSVQMFQLELEIKRKMEENGAIVTYYDERPSNNNFTKGIIRLKRSIYQYKIDNYYKKILKSSLNIKYDYLFVNKGEVIPVFFLKEFKKNNPNCIFIFFTWDSFLNNKYPISILKYFDYKYTFELEDSIKYGINFRPLFFLDSFKALNNNKYTTKYDLLFLGTAHSDRYIISQKVAKLLNNIDKKMYCYYYMHGRLVYLFQRLFDKNLKKFNYYKLNFKSLSNSEIIELYKISNIILDINHPNQKGLTMRTFEAIGSGKKIITTNAEIKKYNFYNSNNIYIINRENPVIDAKFFTTKYIPIDENIYFNLSIEGWLNEIFTCNKINWIS